ncbi:MAG: hypothetical protein ACR2HN_00070 [Tepidiformaceae bacterium]
MAEGNGASTSWVSGGRLDDLTAEHVTVDRSAVRSLTADQARLERAAVQRLHATQATFDRSFVGIAQFDQGTVRQSSAGVVVARSVACDQVRTLVLAAPVVRGEVHTWLDVRSALAIGVGMVLGKALLGGGRALARRVTR